MKNRPVSCLSGILILLTIAGCAKTQTLLSDNQNIDESSKSHQTQNQFQPQTSNEDDPNKLSPAQTPDMPEEITASQEILDAELYSNTIQIGNKALTCPLRYDDIVASGAKLNPGYYGITEGYLINSGETVETNWELGSGSFSVYMRNNTNMVQVLKDADIDSSYGISSNSSDIFFPIGIRVGDSFSTLIEKWGQPTVDESFSGSRPLAYRYLEYPIKKWRLWSDPGSTDAVGDLVSATDCEYSLQIDRRTSEITKVHFSWKEKNGNEALVGNTASGTVVYSVYIVDGAPYVIVIDITTFIPIYYGNAGTEELLRDFMIDDRLFEDDIQYDIEQLSVSDGGGTAIGYLYSGNTLHCRTMYIDETMNAKAEGRDSRIFPVDENAALSEEAVVKFKEIMKNFVDSISITKK